MNEVSETERSKGFADRLELVAEEVQAAIVNLTPEDREELQDNLGCSENEVPITVGWDEDQIEWCLGHDDFLGSHISVSVTDDRKNLAVDIYGGLEACG